MQLDAAEFADRLAAGERFTVLDVRGDAEGGVEAPSLATLHVPADAVVNDIDRIASTLSGPVAVVCARGRTASPIAEVLREKGVDARVLEGGTRAWMGTLQARPVDLDVAGLQVIQVQRPARGCLSYLIAAGGSAIVVDPAPDAGFYVDLADRLGAGIEEVFDTHLHADHLSGARALAARTGARLRLPALTLERGVSYEADVVPLGDGDRTELGGVPVRALSLPGHTTDMTGLMVADRALLSGDSLFADGIARPDLQAGTEGARDMARTLHETLHERILPLGEDVVVLPGHTHPGVLDGPVRPTLGEVRAAVRELSIGDPADFAATILHAMPPRPANYESIIAANAGRAPLDPELESGGNSCATR